MKAGTIIKTESGRVGTVVYHYLDGYGVAWGRHELGPDEGDWPEREAMLREPYPSAEVECVTEPWVIEREDAPRRVM